MVGAERDLPERFAEPESANELTLAVLGESSAFGTPFERWFSIGKIVAWQLELAVPGRKVRVEMLARRADTLADQYRRLARLSKRPDALIVYCGHNEFLNDVPWFRTVIHYHDEEPPLVRRIDELAGRVSPLCGLLRKTADKFRAAVMPTRDARHYSLVDSPAYTAAEYAANLSNFRRRLESIARWCQAWVCWRSSSCRRRTTPAGTRTGRSCQRKPRGRRSDEFAREFLAAGDLEDSRPAQAVARYRRLLSQQPTFAETHYRLGRLLENAGAWEEAYECYVRARDFDGLPSRCVTAFQDVYHEVAAHHDCLVVDGQALFHAIGPHGLLDDHLFQDGVHPSLRGHVALAQGVLDAIQASGALGWPKAQPSRRVDVAECAAHFGLEAADWRAIADMSCVAQYVGASVR